MMNLTFGEQVKIVLSRKGMTIKELAEMIEERTGKKMSRQNLTQRLGRDNFQEQDMRMIADILGCSFQLNILASAESVEKASAVEIEEPTERELEKARKRAQKQPKVYEEEHTSAEREITIGELIDIDDIEEQDMPQEAEGEKTAKEPVRTVPEESAGVDEEPELTEQQRRRKIFKDYGKKPESENGEKGQDEKTGEINPYTGKEYETNSVRIHPKRIGYVQVYDRSSHTWTDMTEWAFLGYQERKKALLGKEYKPPIYLD